MQNQADHSSRAAIFGGTMFALFNTVGAEELLKTIVMAAVGAAVSYTVSFFLAKLAKKKK